MMDPYLQKFNGRVQLNGIMSAANTSLRDLPSLADCKQGDRNNLHYLGLLGHCPHHANGRCRFDHVPRQAVPNGFADSICRVMGPGVEYMVRNGRNPPGQDNKDHRQGEEEMCGAGTETPGQAMQSNVIER